MFERLPESRPDRRRPWWQSAVSIAAHVVLVSAAVELTRAAAEVPARPVDLDAVHFAAPPTAHTEVATSAHAAAGLAATAAPVIVSVAVPTTVPIGIPPVDLHAGAPSALTSIGTGTIGPLLRDDASGVGNGAASPDQVDETAVFVSGPEPFYPPALRAIGITGVVTMRYIIDRDGHVDSASVQVTASTNHGFDPGAIAAVRGALFRPARIRGVSVRELVEQAVRFTIR